MAEVIRPVSYTGTMQRLIVDSTTTGNVTAYLWGGAGGGGAGDGRIVGGSGGGGNYSTVTFSVVPGDVIDVAVGQGGGPGTGSRYLVGGPGGASYQAVDPVWTTLSLIPAVSRAISQPYYDQFVNLYGVTGSLVSYDQTFTVPSTDVYQFRADGRGGSSGNFIIDPGPGQISISLGNNILVTLAAGSHVIRSTLSGGSTSCSLRLASALYTGYSGAQGGYSGAAGSSGSGGGGGGATVLFLNGSLLAVAGGGAGAGGAGVRGGSGNAPNETSRAAPGTNAGREGQGQQVAPTYDGGGGGAGGGGYGGGDGGNAGFGDVSGVGGAQGGNFGPDTAMATGQQPANANSPYRFGSAGVGGTGGGVGIPFTGGSPGLATFVFDVIGSFVKSGGIWTPIQETYIKDQGVWKSVLEQYVKQNGQWRLVSGTNATAPTFTGIQGNFGVSYRVLPAPPPPPPD